MEGVFRFLKRAHRILSQSEISEAEPQGELRRAMHAAIKKVSSDIESFGFNTAISALMIYLNELAKAPALPRQAAETFILLLSPFAPHLCEELWEHYGHSDTLAYEPFPQYDEKELEQSEIEILVQVLGKPKARLMMPVGCSAAEAQEIAFADDTVKAAMGGKEPRKVIYVPGRLINIVI